MATKRSFAAGIGAYYEVPKTECKLDIVTSVLSDDLQLKAVNTLNLIDTTGNDDYFAQGEIFPCNASSSRSEWRPLRPMVDR